MGCRRYLVSDAPVLVQVSILQHEIVMYDLILMMLRSWVVQQARLRQLKREDGGENVVLHGKIE